MTYKYYSKATSPRLTLTVLISYDSVALVKPSNFYISDTFLFIQLKLLVERVSR